MYEDRRGARGGVVAKTVRNPGSKRILTMQRGKKLELGMVSSYLARG